MEDFTPTWEYHAVIRRPRQKPRIRKSLLASLGSIAAAIPLVLVMSPGEATRFSMRELPDLEQNTHRLLPLADVVLVKPKRVHFAKDDADAKSFRNLNSYYVGKAKAKIDWSDVDLSQNVKFMWDRKLSILTVSPATQKAVKRILSDYERADHNTTTLDAYVKRADHVVNNARNGLDYTGLCARYGLSSDRCVRLQYLAGRISGKSLVAYGMTELFPSHDGDTNRKMLDMMLRRAGTDYLDVIPALGDGYLSMGFYQFTSFAVRVDGEGRQGASIVSQFAAPNQRIPQSVMNLKGDDQHRAAFYFAVQNLAQLLMEPRWDASGKQTRSGLSNAQYATLKAHSPISEVDLTTFMAAAHHLPGGARKAVAAWLNGGCSRPLRDYLRGDLPIYGKKSVSNFKALT